MSKLNASMVSAKDFKELYIQGEITIPPSRWAISTKEALKAGIPSPHYLEGHYLIRCSIESIVERISRFFQNDFYNESLFVARFDDHKLFRLYNLWSSEQPVTPPVIRAFESTSGNPDLEIIEGNHRIKLSLINKSESIPVLVQPYLEGYPDPFKNEWFKANYVNQKI